MTFSRAQYLENTGKNEALPRRLRSYFAQRFQQKAFSRLAKAFAQRAEETGLTQSGLAMMIARDKGQVNRLLSNPTNMTLDTYAELCLALNYEPSIMLEDLSEPARHNFSHPAYTVASPPRAPENTAAGSSWTPVTILNREALNV